VCFFPFRYLSYLEHNTDYCLITQAISRRPLAAGSRVRKYADLSGVCGGQSDGGTSFLQVLQFSTDSVVPQFFLLFFYLSRALCIRNNRQRRLMTQLKLARKFILILYFSLRMGLWLNWINSLLQCRIKHIKFGTVPDNSKYVTNHLRPCGHFTYRDF
jgi:hypothetical protein